MKNKRLSYFLLLFVLSGLMSCANISSSGRADFQLAEATKEPITETNRDYILQIGDIIDIKFYYDPKLNETVIIRPDGKISLQLVGEIAAAEQTPSELNKVIISRYAKFLKNPEPVVIVREFGGQKAYVGGEVAAPGVIPIKGRTTVLQVILNAGGFRETAHKGNVIVISRGPENTSVTRKIDLSKVISGKGDGKDVLVKPFDVIYVPKTAIAEVDKFVEQYITKIIPGSLTSGFSYGVFKTPIP